VALRASSLPFPELVRAIVEAYGSTFDFLDRAYEVPGLGDELMKLDALGRGGGVSLGEVEERKLRLAAAWLMDDAPQSSSPLRISPDRRDW
jgi:hypothetical protein